MAPHRLETARKLGARFASSLNGTPVAASWHRLDSSDNLPELDYIALTNEFGACPREMKRAYREGFNGSFNAIDADCLAWWVAMSGAAQRNVMYHAQTTDIAKAWSWHRWVQIQDARAD